MAFVRKNIWLAFYTVLFLGFIFLGTAIFATYKDAFDEFKTEQENITLMSANSFKSLFKQYEVVLDILAKEVLLSEMYTDKTYSQQIIDSLLSIEHSTDAFGIFKPNGDFYLATSNIKLPENYNLLNQEEARESFLKTFNSRHTVLGRTYYNKGLKRLIVPIRKAVKDKSNKVVFVVSTAIGLKEGFDFFVNNKNSFHSTFIYRDSDRYFQLAPKEKFNNPLIYNYQIPKKEVEKAIDSLVKEHKVSMETIKNNEMIISRVNSHPKRKSLTSSVYLKDYDLWITTEIKMSHIYNDVLKKVSILIVVFIMAIAIIYWLFRSIARAEHQKQKALKFQATHDYLTYLKNRFYLDEKYQNLEESFFLIFIDTDNFKYINDNYGHEYGDEVLKEISKRLTGFVEGQDEVIRYSGDEFIYIHYGDDKSKTQKLCQEILDSLSKVYKIESYKFFLSASIGISSFPEDGSSIDELKRYADLALYEAKKEKNQYVFFEGYIKDNYAYGMELEYELKGALKNQEFFLTYQAQVDNKNEIFGVEALLRWENEKLGFIPPDRFIPLAESTGLMPSIGDFVLTRSLKEIKGLEDELNTKINLSVNISVKQVVHDDFVEKVLDFIKEYNFDSLNLVLEVTESIFIEDVEGITNKLLELKDVGIHISLDDFGTGYSSLSLLKRLPIDELKIDKSFVNDVLENEDSLSMVEGIIAIAKKLKMSIVAGGIETKEQKELLSKLGCDIYQGYYFAKPLKIEDFKEFYSSFEG